MPASRHGIEGSFVLSPWEGETPYDATGPARVALAVSSAAGAVASTANTAFAAQKNYYDSVNERNRRRYAADSWLYQARQREETRQRNERLRWFQEQEKKNPVPTAPGKINPVGLDQSRVNELNGLELTYSFATQVTSYRDLFRSIGRDFLSEAQIEQRYGPDPHDKTDEDTNYQSR